MDVGKYKIGAFIGKGASGHVYEGIDSSTGERRGAGVYCASAAAAVLLAR